MQKLQIHNGAVGVDVSFNYGDGEADAVKIRRPVMRALLKQYGFDPDLIEDIDAEDALVRAVHSAPRTKTMKVMEIVRPNKDTPRAWGVYSVSAGSGEQGDDFVLRARLRVEGDRVVVRPAEGSAIIEPVYQAVAERTANMANEMYEFTVNADVGRALRHIGREVLGWISRARNRGGVWFILAAKGAGQEATDRAQRYVNLLHDIAAATSNEERGSQFIPQVTDVFPSPLTMQTYAASSRDHFEQEVRKLDEKLEKMRTKGTMRESTMGDAADEADQLINQAESYRRFLADAADTFKAKLAEIRDAFRTAQAEAADEAGDALDQISRLARKPEAAKPAAAPRKVAPAPRAESIDDMFEAIAKAAGR